MLNKNFERSQSFSSRKPLETESSAESQFLIGNCCLVSQSNYLNNCNTDCDWLILACTEQMHADASFFLVCKIKFGLKIQPNAKGTFYIICHKTNKEAPTVFCSVVKHLESFVSCSPLHFAPALQRLPACFTADQSTFQASSFVTLNITAKFMQQK